MFIPTPMKSTERELEIMHRWLNVLLKWNQSVVLLTQNTDAGAAVVQELLLCLKQHLKHADTKTQDAFDHAFHPDFPVSLNCCVQKHSKAPNSRTCPWLSRPSSPKWMGTARFEMRIEATSWLKRSQFFWELLQKRTDNNYKKIKK